MYLPLIIFSFFLKCFIGGQLGWAWDDPACFETWVAVVCQHLLVTISTFIRSTYLGNALSPLTVQYLNFRFSNNNGILIPGSSISGYKNPLFACTKAILCNMQNTGVRAIVSVWFIINICVDIKTPWNFQASSTWTDLGNSMHDIHNASGFICLYNRGRELTEEKYFLGNSPFASVKHWWEQGNSRDTAGVTGRCCPTFQVSGEIFSCPSCSFRGKDRGLSWAGLAAAALLWLMVPDLWQPLAEPRCSLVYLFR